MAVFVVLLTGIAALCRWHFGSWLAPAACVAGFWAAEVALPAILAPDFGYSSLAIAYLAVGVVVFGLGAFLAAPRHEDPVPTSPPEPPTRLGARALVAMSLAGSGAGLGALAATVVGGGFSIESLLSFGGLLRVGNAISVARYDQAGPASLLVPLLLTVLYAGALASPFTRLAGTRSRWIRYGPLLAATLFSLVSTERLVMLTAVTLTVGSEAVTTLIRGASLGRLGLRLGVVAATVGVLFGGIAFVRVGSVDASTGATVMTNLRSYAFGYLAGYSQWFDDYVGLRNGIPTSEPTFFAPLDYIRPGLHELGSTRGYKDGRSFGSDGGTNIFTMVRAVVVELGLGGATVFLAVAGFVTTRWYRAVCQGRGRLWGPWLAAFVATTLLSSTQSLFSFSNTCVGVLGGAVAVTVCLRPRHFATLPGGTPATENGSVRKRALSAPLPRN